MHLLSSRLPAIVLSRSRATYYQSPRKFPPAFVRRFLIRYPRTPIYIVVGLCVMPMLYPWYVGLKLFFTVSREEYEAKRMETKALVYERAAFGTNWWFPFMSKDKNDPVISEEENAKIKALVKK